MIQPMARERDQDAGIDPEVDDRDRQPAFLSLRSARGKTVDAGRFESLLASVVSHDSHSYLAEHVIGLIYSIVAVGL